MNKLRVNFYLKTNQPDKNGEYPILVKLSLSKTKESLSWQIGLKTKSKTLKNNTCLGDYEVTHEINKMRSRLLNIYDELLASNSFSLLALKEKYNTYLQPKTEYLFSSFCANILKEKEELYIKGKVSSTIPSIYKRTLNAFLSFIKEKYGINDIYLLSLRPNHIDGFHQYLTHTLDFKKTTICNYITTLASIIKVAKKKCIITIDLFENISISPVYATDRKFLTENEILNICSLNLKKENEIIVRDCFIFSCLTGLSFSDIKALNDSHIRIIEGKEWIYKDRIKTSAPLRVYLLNNAYSIILKYKALYPDRETFFPLSTNKQTNLILKRIFKRTNIPLNYSFHCGRHSFATLALTKNMSLESISSLLGHKNLQTTKIYAKVIHSKIRNEMSDFETKISINI